MRLFRSIVILFCVVLAFSSVASATDVVIGRVPTDGMFNGNHKCTGFMNTVSLWGIGHSSGDYWHCDNGIRYGAKYVQGSDNGYPNMDHCCVIPDTVFNPWGTDHQAHVIDTYSFNVDGTVSAASLTNVRFDDYFQVQINGQAVYTQGGFNSNGKCKSTGNHEYVPNLDVTSYFKPGINRVDIIGCRASGTTVPDAWARLTYSYTPCPDPVCPGHPWCGTVANACGKQVSCGCNSGESCDDNNHQCVGPGTPTITSCDFNQNGNFGDDINTLHRCQANQINAYGWYDLVTWANTCDIVNPLNMYTYHDVGTVGYSLAVSSPAPAYTPGSGGPNVGYMCSVWAANYDGQSTGASLSNGVWSSVEGGGACITTPWAVFNVATVDGYPLSDFGPGNILARCSRHSPWAPSYTYEQYFDSMGGSECGSQDPQGMGWVWTSLPQCCSTSPSTTSSHCEGDTLVTQDFACHTTNVNCKNYGPNEGCDPGPPAHCACLPSSPGVAPACGPTRCGNVGFDDGCGGSTIACGDCPAHFTCHNTYCSCDEKSYCSGGTHGTPLTYVHVAKDSCAVTDNDCTAATPVDTCDADGMTLHQYTPTCFDGTGCSFTQKDTYCPSEAVGATCGTVGTTAACVTPSCPGAQCCTANPTTNKNACSSHPPAGGWLTTVGLDQSGMCRASSVSCHCVTPSLNGIAQLPQCMDCPAPGFYCDNDGTYYSEDGSCDRQDYTCPAGQVCVSPDGGGPASDPSTLCKSCVPLTQSDLQSQCAGHCGDYAVTEPNCDSLVTLHCGSCSDSSCSCNPDSNTCMRPGDQQCPSYWECGSVTQCGAGVSCGSCPAGTCDVSGDADDHTCVCPETTTCAPDHHTIINDLRDCSEGESVCPDTSPYCDDSSGTAVCINPQCQDTLNNNPTDPLFPSAIDMNDPGCASPTDNSELVHYNCTTTEPVQLPGVRGTWIESFMNETGRGEYPNGLWVPFKTVHDGCTDKPDGVVSEYGAYLTEYACGLDGHIVRQDTQCPEGYFCEHNECITSDPHLYCEIKQVSDMSARQPAGTAQQTDACVVGLSDTTNAHGQSCTSSNGKPFYTAPDALVCSTDIPKCSFQCFQINITDNCSDQEQEMFEMNGIMTGPYIDNAHGAINGSNWGMQKMCCDFTNGTRGGYQDCGYLGCNWQYNACSPGNTTVVRFDERNDSMFSLTQYNWSLCCDLKFQCSDGIDNDGDGYVDYAGIPTAAADPGCLSPTQNHEWNVFGPQCDNTFDDDGDGFIDYRVPGYIPLNRTGTLARREGWMPQTNLLNVSGDHDCLNVTDDDEGLHLPPSLTCTDWCTINQSGVDTGICSADCMGVGNCGQGDVVPICDKRAIGSSVPVDQQHFAYCCNATGSYDNIDSSSLTFETDRDRIASKRIRRTAAGDTVIINLYNFK